MSLTLSIIIAVSIFAILIIADNINYLLSSGILFMLFMWGMITFDMTTLQKIFYPIGIVFYLAVKANMGDKLQTTATSADINGSKRGGYFSGLRYHIFSIVVGIVMLGFMFLMTSAKGQFLGVSTLSISTSGFSAWATAQFAPAISLALGFIENRMFIAWLNILLVSKAALSGLLSLILPILTPLVLIIPVGITALTFGLFHIIAYSVSWSKILWAAAIMVIWIISYYMTGKDTTAMDTAHGGWNGLLTAKETLSIAI